MRGVVAEAPEFGKTLLMLPMSLLLLLPDSISSAVNGVAVADWVFVTTRVVVFGEFFFVCLTLDFFSCFVSRTLSERGGVGWFDDDVDVANFLLLLLGFTGFFVDCNSSSSFSFSSSYGVSVTVDRELANKGLVLLPFAGVIGVVGVVGVTGSECGRLLINAGFVPAEALLVVDFLLVYFLLFVLDATLEKLVGLLTTGCGAAPFGGSIPFFFGFVAIGVGAFELEPCLGDAIFLFSFSNISSCF